MLPHFVNRILHKLAFVVPGGEKIRPGIHRLRGAHIGKNVWISQSVYIDVLHPEAVFIGDNSTLGFRTSIFSHFYWGPRRSSNGFKKVVIEKNVFIGPHCLILPGVHVGEGAVVKGGSVLSSNVPANTFWGPPASGPLGRVSVPLTPETSFDEFVRGLRPYRKNKAN
jgi:acetyltransferase-like isoleucine patch superfamily enzyme